MSGGARADGRPPLAPGLGAEEFARWYWLKRELEAFAREIGVSAAGGKREIASRIAARLAGEQDVPAPVSRGARGCFAGDLTPDSRIPRDPPLDARLRAFMTAACGPGFRYDGHMRDFFRNGEGSTLADAIEHWRATRGLPPGEIAPQFEYNRFARKWRAAHPGSTHAEMAAAWNERKRRPVGSGR